MAAKVKSLLFPIFPIYVYSKLVVRKLKHFTRIELVHTNNIQ